MKFACGAFVLLACTSAQALDYTAAYALMTDDGHYAGSVMAARNFKGTQGDCLFSLLPADTDGFSSMFGIAVGKLKDLGELHWHKRNGAIVIEDHASTVLTIAADGAVRDAHETRLGVAFAMPEVD